MKKEFVSIAYVSDIIFGRRFYDHYSGYVIENTKRGTSIVSVECDRTSEGMKKVIRVGLFKMFKKTIVKGFGLYRIYKKPKLMEFDSKRLKRENEKEFHEEFIKSIDIIKKMFVDGWVPEKKWIRSYLSPLNTRKVKA